MMLQLLFWRLIKMQYLKFSFLLIVLFSSSLFAEKFNSKECLSSSFKTTIKSKGKFFGLIKNNVLIDKDKCKIKIQHQGILDSTWNIDICREPIHMKVMSKGSENVFKRSEDCTDKSTSDYCYYLKELKTNISDYGLIFAEGLREKLKDPHGQVYCVSLLVNRYFDDQVVFSLFNEPKDIYTKELEGCTLPENEKKDEIVNNQVLESSIKKEETSVLLNSSKAEEKLKSEQVTEKKDKF